MRFHPIDPLANLIKMKIKQSLSFSVEILGLNSLCVVAKLNFVYDGNRKQIGRTEITFSHSTITHSSYYSIRKLPMTLPIYLPSTSPIKKLLTTIRSFQLDSPSNLP